MATTATPTTVTREPYKLSDIAGVQKYQGIMGASATGATKDTGSYGYTPVGETTPFGTATAGATGGTATGGTATSAKNQTFNFGSIADPVEAQRAKLNNAENLAAQFGNINYDQDAITGIFNDSTEAEYATKRAEYDRSANKYYSNLGTSQSAYLQAMREQAAQNAVQSGANMGMQNATQLASVMGLQQQTAEDALGLAQQKRALEDQYAEAIAGNTERGMTYADQNRIQLANIANQEMANNAQQYTAELSHNAALSTAASEAAATGYAADQALAGTEYNANANLEGTKYGADKGLEGTRYNADKVYEGNVYTSDRNLEGTKYNADTNKSIAETQAAAQRAAARSAANAAKSYADAQKYVAETGIIVAGLGNLQGMSDTDKNKWVQDSADMVFK